MCNRKATILLRLNASQSSKQCTVRNFSVAIVCSLELCTITSSVKSRLLGKVDAVHVGVLSSEEITL